MRTRDTTARRMALAGILALGGALASAGPAAAAVPIMQCGTTIGTPGTYVLAADLTCPFGVIGIVVQADNVHLVLGKHSITLINRTGNGIYASNVTGLRIEGGTIVGFGIGIGIQGGSGVRVSGTTVLNSFAGIVLNDCAGCQITDSRASGHSADGISIGGSSLNVRVADNTATDNQRFGIEVRLGVRGARLTDNVATGNNPGNFPGDADLSDHNPGPPCANTWRDNTFGSAAGAGAACIR